MTHDWQTQDLESQRRFARNLRAARERAQLTQADVAEAMEMTVTVYARYERGKIWPSIGALRRLCDVLGCSADTLLGLEPAAEPEAPAAPSEPLPMRRLRRQLRQASPETLHVVEQMLDKLEEHGVLPAPDDDVADRPPDDAAGGGPGAEPGAEPGIEPGMKIEPDAPAGDHPADAPADDSPPGTPAGDRPADDVPGDR